MASETPTDGRVTRIADHIRQFAAEVDEPDDWRVEIPEDVFNAVKRRLETERHAGVEHHGGVQLLYTPYHDEPHVEYRMALADHLAGGGVEDGE